MHPINRRTACTQVCFILTLGARFALTVTARAQAPRVVGGVPQDPYDSVSMAYTFAQPQATERRTTHYCEMLGHRGIYQDGWYAMTFHGRPPWQATAEFKEFDQDTWELYKGDEHNQRAPSAAECTAPAQDLIIQVDGGHIPIQEKDKRSFEALSALVYRPEHLPAVDQHHRQIMEKTCVILAGDDHVQTMQASLINAAHQQGISPETQVTAFADGAKNCWEVL